MLTNLLPPLVKGLGEREVTRIVRALYQIIIEKSASKMVNT